MTFERKEDGNLPEIVNKRSEHGRRPATEVCIWQQPERVEVRRRSAHEGHFRRGHGSNNDVRDEEAQRIDGLHIILVRVVDE